MVIERDLEELDRMYAEEYSAAEIAAAIGMSIPNVYRYIALRVPAERRRGRAWKRGGKGVGDMSAPPKPV